ncbi:S8 family serine peptidase [Clostridium beijerinckii]|uniref:S8 family serine peptidase n=1 Tax=Clostridium beijerinckii TaxID=1520 RepID=UPI00030D1422|nr:S8 family serine peptidase [Clostridium beijerinckii]
MPELETQISSKVDASIGLLANVPKAILDELGYKYQSQGNNVELTILYRDTQEQTKSFVEGLGGTFQDLGFNFAVVNIPRDKLEQLSMSNSIQYIELPKNLYEQDQESNRASCILQLAPDFDVSGEGILVGFVDSGIDYTHPAFMDSTGTSTRIEYIYDLSTGGNVYNKQMINEAIKSNNPFSVVPSIDNSGHGTHVAGIACGGGRINPMYRGVAPNSSIAMVKAARGTAILSSQIMQGIKFLIDKGKELNMPLVISISLSTNDGAHDGSSLLEQYIRTISNLERVSIVIAAGNEGDAGHHVGGQLVKTQRQIFNIASEEKSIVMNFYKTILPNISVNIINPTSQGTGNINIQEGYIQGTIGSDRYDIYVSGPKPFELNSEIRIILSARSGFLVEGVWTLEINVTNEYLGAYSIWLPVLEGLNPATKFLEPNQYNTLGIPATVDNIIAVGSYNYRTNNLSSFSGRGAQDQNIVRPDLVAPGEDIAGPVPNGGYDNKTGTSMATPQVSGICALMMQWGIVKGNDPYLFGQRLKYYLLRGARRRRTDVTYPNPLWGYGEVCIFNSLRALQNDLNAILTRGNINSRDIQVTNSVPNKYNILRKNIKREVMENTSSGNTSTNIGRLKIQCFRGDDYIPIDGARITVRTPQGAESVNSIQLVTDSVGLTQVIELTAPPLEYSLNPNSNQVPYSLYDITVERDGFNPIVIRGCQVFPTQVAYQICNLTSNSGRGMMRQEVINIQPNTLNGNFPPKIPEDPEKQLPPPSSGVVLPQPIVPEYIIVHQGGPNDPSAPNYKVPFKDYIKNVASSEIYSTWNESAIRANVFCIVSFTLNRIYTEWYRGKGKNFDITSSTAYDHAFNYGRNIYDSISAIVDEIFSTYIRRVGAKQPLLTQYCDGKSVTCPQWLSQWGSQQLAQQGMVPYDILKNYYGNDIELTTAEKVSGSPQSYPGEPLTIGSSGPSVRTIQNQLNRIARNYPLIPKVAEDGQFNQKTADAVKTFQQIFTLPQTGIVDYATWYRISDIYVGVSRIAELRDSSSLRSTLGMNEFIPPIIPGLDNKRGIPKFYY